ncbi:hypothetical protein KN822_18710 [Bacillus cabrialesii]|nr:hypothetical protein [Bacillus cabrialesii]
MIDSIKFEAHIRRKEDQYPTVRDEMERYPRELLDKICTCLNIELYEL